MEVYDGPIVYIRGAPELPLQSAHTLPMCVCVCDMWTFFLTCVLGSKISHGRVPRLVNK